MEVAMYQFSSLTQGEDTFFFDLASSLSKRGHQVHVITSSQLPLIGGKRNLTKEEVYQRLHSASLHQLRFVSFIPLSSSIHDMGKILKECDLLYTRNEIFELLPLKFFKLKSNIPVVCGFHTYIAPCLPVAHLSTRAWIRYVFHRSPVYRKLLYQCNAFHTLNKFDYDLLLSWHKIKEHDVFLIPLGIDTDLFHPQKTSGNRKLFKILFVGRLDEGKGIDILFQSINQLQKTSEFNKMLFTIAGDGKLRPLAVKLSKFYANVKYLGFVPRPKLVNIYNSQDIIVIPSRWETFSYVCLEAQSCGLPAITTTIPGPANVIKHEKTGLLIPPNSWKDLSETILRIFHLRNDEHTFNTMKISARREVLKNYSLKRMTERMELLFKHVSNRCD